MGSWHSLSGANVTTTVDLQGVSTVSDSNQWQSSASGSFAAEREAAMQDPRSWLQRQLKSMSRWIFSHNAHPPNAPRSIMVGLDNAGKTTLLCKLRLDESVVTVPTIGFNVETVSFQGHELTVWDIAGRHITELGGVARGGAARRLDSAPAYAARGADLWERAGGARRRARRAVGSAPRRVLLRGRRGSYVASGTKKIGAL